MFFQQMNKMIFQKNGMYANWFRYTVAVRENPKLMSCSSNFPDSFGVIGNSTAIWTLGVFLEDDI